MEAAGLVNRASRRQTAASQVFSASKTGAPLRPTRACLNQGLLKVLVTLPGTGRAKRRKQTRNEVEEIRVAVAFRHHHHDGDVEPADVLLE